VQQPIIALRPPPAQGREVTLSRLLGAGGLGSGWWRGRSLHASKQRLE
jgi:hypothetical protein